MTDDKQQAANTSALAQYVKTNTARGEELVLGPIREGKSIDAEHLIDLLSWARTATGEVMMTSTDGSTLTFSAGRVPASVEPTLRLAAAIRQMTSLMNALIAAGVSIGPGQ